MDGVGFIAEAQWSLGFSSQNANQPNAVSLRSVRFFFFLLLSHHLSREKEAWNAGTCAVMCSLYAVLRKKKILSRAANEIYN